MKFAYTFCSLLLISFIAAAKSGDKPIVNSIAHNSTAIEFIENKGQWNGPFLFKARTDRGAVFIQKTGFTFLLEDNSNGFLMDAYHHGQITKPPILKFHAYKVSFLNAKDAEITGSKYRSCYNNYFLGNDASKWASNIHPCLAVDYKELYPGINVHVSSEQKNVKYELLVAPGADASQIQLQYEGQTSLTIHNGNLVIGTSLGEMVELRPYVYQYINNERVSVTCKYNLANNVVSYSFPDGYDETQQLVIDPTVVFATFTGSKADNWGFTATYDEHGNFYAGGIANDVGFPVSTGAFQTTFGGGVGSSAIEYASDIAIIKYNPSGTSRVWATYIGGSDNERPHSMIVDGSDNLVIAGRTYSDNYPTTVGAYNRTFKGGLCDMVITKLRNDGAVLIGSTFMGGTGDDGMNFDSTEVNYGNLKHNYGDDARSEVLLDKQGNVYVTACTKSTDFPVTTYAYSSSNAGGQDAVVFKMNSNLTSLIWSTYIGGSNDDAGYVLAFDTSQKYLYVSGGTQSSNFPSTSGTLHSTYQGGSSDGFILKFQNSAPYTLKKGTFIGTSNDDQCYGIQVDLENNVYVMGQSLGGSYPVTSGVYSNANSSQFIHKLDTALTTTIFSTVFGSGDPSHTNISPVAFLVDTCQNIYISGWGGTLGIASVPSTVGSNSGMPITSDAAQSSTDGSDFYFICFSKDASSLLYGTYMGEVGGAGEHVDGGTSRFDKYGIVYQAICGGCSRGASSTFPTTSGVWSPGDSSTIGNCNEIALKIAFELGNVVAKANAYPSTRGCLPFTVHFGDSSINAKTYTWDFGDGGSDTVRYPIHTFNTMGTFSVRLIIYNPKACKVLDTAYLSIHVDTNFERPGFLPVIQDSCGPYISSFTNTSSYSHTPGAAGFTTFIWDFGDGTGYTGVTPPTHTYSSGGTYQITLVMIDSTACNSPDTIRRTIAMSGVNVAAKFFAPDSICKGEQVTFYDSSSNGTSYSWIFGDGGTSNIATAKHIFDSAGIYSVVFIVSNPASCNGSDTFIKSIKVLQPPIADFTFSPSTPQTNIPTTFTNLSVNATKYAWVFGDGGISSEVNPVHQFKHTGNFNVCLYARNTSNCPSYLCRMVGADVKPLADLPNAFSPNGDGKNDVLYVRGAGIVTMDLKIFNRWGTLIFESNDQSIGWDGTYSGQAQPMEAYAYVLSVTFIDDTKMTKKGNVTLLR